MVGKVVTEHHDNIYMNGRCALPISIMFVENVIFNTINYGMSCAPYTSHQTHYNIPKSPNK